MKEIKIEYKNIDEIIPYENNPRLNDNAVDVIAKSIENFGFKNPIIIDGDNVVVAGHTRLKAALKIGLTKIPTISADDLSDEQIKAFRLADNKTAEIAEWDFEKLNKELDALSDLDIDMSDFGFAKSVDFEINDDDFLLDENLKPKTPKKIKCPNCGEEFEV